MRYLSSARTFSAFATKHILESNGTPHLSTLKNGLRVVTENTGRPAASIGIYVENGSRFETAQNNGVSKFLEHLIYKGTSARTQAQLEKELEALGATLTSRTTRDRTSYIVSAPSFNIEKAFGIVADCIRNPKLDNAAIEAERNVLLQKLEENENDYRRLTFDMLHATAYQGTGLANYPYGTSESIRGITSETLRQWQADNYRAVRMVVSAVGNVNHSNIEQLSQKYFGDLTNDYPGKIPSDLDIRFTGSEFRYRNDAIPAMYAAIAVEGVGYGHADALPLAIAANGIGQWDVTYGASHNAPKRHIQRLAENHSLYSFKQFNINYKNTGLWGLYFVADGKDLEDVTYIHSVIQKEWKHLACALEAPEVDALVNQYRSNFFASIETSIGKANFNAKELLYTGHVRSLADVEEQLGNVTLSAISQAVNRHVYDRDIATAGVGRTEAFPDYDFVRQRMWWWRL